MQTEEDLQLMAKYLVYLENQLRPKSLPLPQSSAPKLLSLSEFLKSFRSLPEKVRSDLVKELQNEVSEDLKEKGQEPQEDEGEKFAYSDF